MAIPYYEMYLLKYVEDAKTCTCISTTLDKTNFQSVDVSSIEVKQLKPFGSNHFCKQTLKRVELPKYLVHLGFNHTLISRALLSIVAHAIFRNLEYKTAQFLDINNTLKACYTTLKRLQTTKTSSILAHHIY